MIVMVNIATKSLFYVIRYFFKSKDMKKRVYGNDRKGLL